MKYKTHLLVNVDITQWKVSLKIIAISEDK